MSMHSNIPTNRQSAVTGGFILSLGTANSDRTIA